MNIYMVEMSSPFSVHYDRLYMSTMSQSEGEKQM